jgi:hypothetical protein
MSTKIICIALTALLLASTCWADGDTRAATGAETEFMRMVRNTLEKAIPASGPEGWSETERSASEVSKHVTQGAEAYPMKMDFRVKWEDSARIEIEKQKQDERLEAMAREMPKGPDPKLQARYNELAEGIGKAAEKGDFKGMERLQREMETVGKEMFAPTEDFDKRIKAESKAAAGRDLYVRLSLGINEAWLSLGHERKGPVKLDAIGGNKTYRMDNEEYSENYAKWVEGTTCVVIGPWKPSDKEQQKALTADLSKKVSHTRVQSAHACAEGTPTRANEVLKKVNWDVLKGLLGK